MTTTNGEHDPKQDLPFSGSMPLSPPELTANEQRMNDFVANLLMSRFERLMGLGTKIERNIVKECGYPEGPLNASVYRETYDQDPLAARVVQVLPKECWQVTPAIFEDEDPETETPFEKAWVDLHRNFRVKSWYQDEEGSPIWDYLLRLDILSGIGHYGVMLLGIDDGLPLDLPLKGFEEYDSYFGVPTGKNSRAHPQGFQVSGEQQGTMPDQQSLGTEMMYGRNPFRGDTQGYDAYTNQLLATQGTPSFTTPVPFNKNPTDSDDSASPGTTRRLIFLKVFDESIAQITRYERDPHNPRFGLPQMYLLTFNDPKHDPSSAAGLPVASAHCHWSRLIHVADNRGSNDVLGYPRMKQVFYRLLDAIKVYGASGEGFWQQAFAMLSLETNPQLGGDIRFDATDRKVMAEQLENIRTKLKRHIMTAGMVVKTLPPALSDPTPYINAFIEVVCIFLGIPVRVFKGSERGELASTQDDSSWNDRLRHRQLFHITPNILVQLIDRLIAVGVLPEPEGYSIVWPDLESLSDDQKAAVALKLVQALVAYISGGGENVMTPLDLLTEFFHMPHEKAKEIIERAQKAIDDEEQLTQKTPEEQAQEQQLQTDASVPTHEKMAAEETGVDPQGEAG